ncbi:hypothetical protein TREMEDRAFT_65925 [Tremella mesenterica DSM 1558]|uniref:uncharacterized protein n=1 Tax=Tremella mesenterica (strain ATCC 24925 / CBS 8224 / DSM 1558 / NBRC 9311 / NRRL Y-6157 / RJB 2259-6 / UBC 559-6) TaxID=578456 RepID=UPI00032C1982|nr:uncharacterized protein TREMEDRAFT_65925 [Tremella mesenterica DSM 1558]EIW66080.1 hypothetical protein TREMEDRAFT_65925 [Tremella mesenterica DSM 1558]
MSKWQIIINPAAGSGQAVQFVDEHVTPSLDVLGEKYEIHHTQQAGDGSRIALDIHRSNHTFKESITTGASSVGGREESYDEVEESGSFERGNKTVRIVIVGGDGTTHEVIEGLCSTLTMEEIGRWEIVVIPCGTANALFHTLFPPTQPFSPPPLLVPYLHDKPLEITHKLSSLLSALSGNSKPRRLPLTRTTLLPPSPIDFQRNYPDFMNPSGSTPQTSSFPITHDTSLTNRKLGDSSSTQRILGHSESGEDLENKVKTLYSHIVLSTSLHASILDTSESLRVIHPGIERFGIAAQQNAGLFFDADLIMFPPTGGEVKQYEPRLDKFVIPFTTDVESPLLLTQQAESYKKRRNNMSNLTIDNEKGNHSEGEGNKEGVVLKGPFSYLLSSTLADRMEEKFMICPTLRTHPPSFLTLFASGLNHRKPLISQEKNTESSMDHDRGKEDEEEEEVPTMDVVILRPFRDPAVRAILETSTLFSNQDEQIGQDPADRPSQNSNPLSSQSSVQSSRNEGQTVLQLKTKVGIEDDGTNTNERKANEQWALRAWEILKLAYSSGSHISRTYSGPGPSVEKGKGEVVVEVFRCGSFEWIPGGLKNDNTSMSMTRNVIEGCGTVKEVNVGQVKDVFEGQVNDNHGGHVNNINGGHVNNIHGGHVDNVQEGHVNEVDEGQSKKVHDERKKKENTNMKTKEDLNNLLCSDGSIHRIPFGGKAKIEVISSYDFWVWG